MGLSEGQNLTVVFHEMVVRTDSSQRQTVTGSD